MRISYVICSHRAPRDLDDALQSVAAEIRGHDAELILVNNGFPAEREREIMTRFRVGTEQLPGAIVGEPQPGLGFARLRGFAASRGEALVMLDDDNVLLPGFDAALRAALARHPRWGSLCPAVIPVWQSPPTRWLRHFGRECLSYTHETPPPIGLPDAEWDAAELDRAERAPGGGMVLHREVVDAYVASVAGTARVTLGRTGKGLGGCEDADLFRHVWRVGRTAVRCTDARLEHRIPASRLRLGYLVRLNWAMTRSYVVLDRLCGLSTARVWVRHGFKQSMREGALAIGEALRFATLRPLLVRGARALGGWSGLLARS